MDVRELNLALRDMAVRRGLCGKWTEAWGDDDGIDVLLDRYVRGFDFTKGGEWPPLDFVREHFDAHDLERHGIYVDRHFDGDELVSGTYVFLGECTGGVRIMPFGVCDIYVCHDTSLRVVAGEFAKVWVTVHGDAVADAVGADTSFVRVRERRHV